MEAKGLDLWYTEEHSKEAKFSIKVLRQLYSVQSPFQKIDILESNELKIPDKTNLLMFDLLDGISTLQKDIENLEIKNVSMKKIIVSSYGIKMASTIGIFEMTGEQYILNEIYQSGAGSKKSLGFSMLDIA